MTTWSYSSIKKFDSCPKQYYHLKVAKDFKDEEGSAALYGKEAHAAAELFIKDNLPLPPKFKFMHPVVSTLKDIPGDKYTELKLGLREDYTPCDFMAPDVWWRGIADLVVIRGDLAYLIDYKTGKSARYADTKQLDILAGALFVHYPQLNRIKSALAFIVSNEFVHKDHVLAFRDSYISCFENELDRLEVAYAQNAWRPRPSGLCGWCVVNTCLHHKKK